MCGYGTRGERRYNRNITAGFLHRTVTYTCPPVSFGVISRTSPRAAGLATTSPTSGATLLTYILHAPVRTGLNSEASSQFDFHLSQPRHFEVGQCRCFYTQHMHCRASAFRSNTVVFGLCSAGRTDEAQGTCLQIHCAQDGTDASKSHQQ